MAIAVLAGIGAQIFASTAIYRPFWRRLLAIAIGITVAGLGGSIVVSGRNATFVVASVTFGIWLILSIGLLLAQPETDAPADGRRRWSLWRWAVIGLVAANLLWAAWPLLPMLSPAIFNQSIASADFLQAQPGSYRFFVKDTFDYEVKFNQYYRFDTFGPSEVKYWQRLRATLVPNLGVYAALRSANNDDPLTVGHWQQLTELLKTADPALQARLLGLMNVGYMIDAPGQDIEPVIYQDERMAIYRIPAPQPRAYFVSRAFLAGDDNLAVGLDRTPHHVKNIVAGHRRNLEPEYAVRCQFVCHCLPARTVLATHTAACNPAPKSGGGQARQS